MNRSILLRLAPPSVFASVVLTLAGCASSDGAPSSSSEDDITPQEIAAGEAAPPGSTDAVADGVEPNDDALELAVGAAVTTPAEDSTGFLDAEEAALPPQPIVPGVIDPDSLDQTQSCHRATGYRSGHKFTICLTTIDGRYVEVNTARAYLRMRKAARKAGVYMHIVSGFRSMAQQRYLYHCYKTRACNGGNLAAVPGYSNHQSGHALDLNTAAGGVYGWLAKHGHAYGFRRTVPSEKWHWEH